MSDEARKTIARLVSDLQGGVHVDDLPEGDPYKTVGKDVGDTITRVVGMLAVSFPNEHVNRLMGQVWHLFGSKTVPTVLYDVRSPSVAAMVVPGTGKSMTVALFPFSWALMAKANPYNAMGAMVFVGSQVVDAYNDRVRTSADGVDVRMRARANEAECLLAIQRDVPTWKPDEYQKGVLAEFPQGVETPSVKGLWYEPKPPPESPPPAFSA